MSKTKARIGIFDIETAPKLAYVWRFWKENIGAKQVLEHCEMLSFAWKWLGESKVHYFDVRKQGLDSEKQLIERLHGFLDEADIVVAHNGDKFDLGTFNGRALIHGLAPPAPYKTVDTLKVARKKFCFESNRLEYLARVLECTEKDSHKEFPGFELWAECLAGNRKAWNEMKKYNIQDVETLEEIYLKMLPYIDNHPNVALINSSEVPACNKCGSENLTRQGYVNLTSGRYQKFQCNDCGGWTRSRYTLLSAEEGKNLTVNAVVG